MKEAEFVARLRGAAAAGVRPGLERIKGLLARLGNPQEGLAAVHIAGTNGKGSTAAMLAGIFSAAGYRTGLYTSPHLEKYTERFVINGEPIPEERLLALLEGLVPLVEAFVGEGGARPTEFEILTALAFIYFREEQVDIAVLETGLGGRLDATNVVIPEVAIITGVSLDHTAYLGQDLAAVAREKAGIIKHRVPVVTAAEGVPLEVIRDRCARLGAPLYVVGKDITFRGEALDLAAQRITVHSRGKTYADLILPLLGVHQQANAACAVAAADLLREKGYRTTGEAIARGLAGVWWPGRFEVVRRTPLTILDGAHNPAGAAALVEAARQHLGGRKLVLVLGILDDKDRESMVQRLAPLAKEIIVTRPPGARAANWRGVAAAARRYRRAVWEVEDPRSAVKEAFKRAGSGGAVLVTGSLYLVGAVRALFPAGERNGAPWEDSRPGACPPRQPARRG